LKKLSKIFKKSLGVTKKSHFFAPALKTKQRSQTLITTGNTGHWALFLGTLGGAKSLKAF
jgi:hypothetical protein